MESLWWNRQLFMDRCRITILDDEDKIVSTIYADPRDSTKEVNQQRVLSVENTKRILASQNMLHQPLEYRATPVLLLAQEDKLWSDIILSIDKVDFCETQKLLKTWKIMSQDHSML